MSTIPTELKWRTLTGVVNEIKSPNQFLKKLLFPNHVTVPTEDIELSIISRGREIAPFVRKNGEAISVGGYSSGSQSVQAPNIRIKRPFTPSELLFGRRPGSVIYLPNARVQATAIQQHVARDMQGMADMITNAEEWLCAMAIQGTISYEVADQEVFTITYPKPAGNTITLSTFWDDATPADVEFDANILAVKRVLSEASCPAPTDCILGSEASAALMTYLASGANKSIMTTSGVNAGMATFVEQFTDDGVIFLGTLHGIRFWEYSRTATDAAGTVQSMIRSKYAEFVSVSPASERVLYYGAIPDMKVLQGQLLQAERFSKSWEIEDPSSMVALIASRPLPVTRRPAATVSVKVVSG